MNLDEVFGLSATDPMVATNPLLLAGGVGVAILLGWWCVRKYADTNDFQKSSLLYLPLAVANCLLFWGLGVPLLFSFGGQLCGFVAMTWISNYYFYH